MVALSAPLSRNQFRSNPDAIRLIISQLIVGSKSNLPRIFHQFAHLSSRRQHIGCFDNSTKVSTHPS